MNDENGPGAVARAFGMIVWLVIIGFVVVALVLSAATTVAPLGELRRLDEQQQQDIVIR